jgi:hypothetical protein
MSDLGRAIAKVISCKLLVPYDQVCFHAAHVEFVVDKGERTGTVSLQLLQFFQVEVNDGPFKTAAQQGQCHSTTRITSCDIHDSHGSDYEAYYLLV